MMGMVMETFNGDHKVGMDAMVITRPSKMKFGMAGVGSQIRKIIGITILVIRIGQSPEKMPMAISHPRMGEAGGKENKVP